MTRKHGVTDEDIRREEENDERNYRWLRDGNWGCLPLLVSGICIPLLLLVSTLTA